MRLAIGLLLVLTGCLDDILDTDDNLQPRGVCGDGDRDTDFESCDDGNTVPGDGCDADCDSEPRARGVWSFVDHLPNECPPGHALAQLRLEAEDPGSPSFQFEAACTAGRVSGFVLPGRYFASIAILDTNGAQLLHSSSEVVSGSFEIQRQFAVP